MPNIGYMHPYVVHIVVGFVIAGCVLRIISLTGKWTWMKSPGDGGSARGSR